MKEYRALISTYIQAESDKEAHRIADEQAAAVLDPSGRATVGHAVVSKHPIPS